MHRLARTPGEAGSTAVGGARLPLVAKVGKTRDGGPSAFDAGLLRLRFERCDEPAVFDHVGERFARLDLAGEGQKGRPHGVIEPAVGDDHVEDRLRLAGDRLPDAERVKQSARRRDNRRGTFVARMARPERRVGDRHREG
jgi:hypothetical protein